MSSESAEASAPELEIDADHDDGDQDHNDTRDHHSNQEEPTDEEIEEIEPTSEELAGDDGGLFSGVEDAESDSESDEDESRGESDTGTNHGQRAGSGQGPSLQFEQAINQGAARLAVVGLDEDEHDVDSLEAEFCEVFETFKLGYFGAETIDEYLMVEDEDVNPVWGLAATIAACAAFTLWVRPDGDEQIKRARDAINSIANGQEVAT